MPRLDKLGVPREGLRRIRAILHRAKTTGLAAQNREGRPDFEAWLRGKIAYFAMIDRDRATKLLAALQAAPPRAPQVLHSMCVSVRARSSHPIVLVREYSGQVGGARTQF